MTSTHSPGDTFAPGTTTVTYTATDAASNTTTSSFTVTVTDAQAPSLTDMPGNITQSNDAGDCSAVVNWTAPNHSDNCSSVLSSTHDSGDTFAVGTTTVTYTATDPAGNTASASFTVTVEDDEDPAITAASNQTVECDGAGNSTDLNAWLASNGGATATDNCSEITWSHNYTECDGCLLYTSPSPRDPE